ncbi:MAG: hypothetical protein M3Q65_23345 [Chloroflexota bacterium]|nr:hypothetical protein [Chloroflexota bacterium]
MGTERDQTGPITAAQFEELDRKFDEIGRKLDTWLRQADTPPTRDPPPAPALHAGAAVAGPPAPARPLRAARRHPGGDG